MTNPQDTPAPSTLVLVLTIAAPILVLFALIGALGSSLIQTFGSYGSFLEAFIAYGIEFLLAVPVPLLLLVLAVRARRRGARARRYTVGIWMGAVTLAIGALVTTLPFVFATADLVRSTQPVAESQTEYTWSELEALSADFVSDSLVGVNVVANGEAEGNSTQCTLSNMERGDVFITDPSFTTTDSEQDTLNAIADAWEDKGYRVDGRGTREISADLDAPFDTVTVTWLEPDIADDQFFFWIESNCYAL